MENVWESEDGLSVREYGFRNYFWDVGFCWVGNDHIAIWGESQINNKPPSRVRIYNVQDGTLRRSIHKAHITPYNAWPPGSLTPGCMVFDHYLFTVSRASGTRVWDIDTGERVCYNRSFRPHRYHPNSKQFLTLSTDSSIVLSNFIGS